MIRCHRNQRHTTFSLISVKVIFLIAIQNFIHICEVLLQRTSRIRKLWIDSQYVYKGKDRILGSHRSCDRKSLGSTQDKSRKAFGRIIPDYVGMNWSHSLSPSFVLSCPVRATESSLIRFRSCLLRRASISVNAESRSVRMFSSGSRLSVMFCHILEYHVRGLRLSCLDILCLVEASSHPCKVLLW
jgi:hypothetical protein